MDHEASLIRDGSIRGKSPADGHELPEIACTDPAGLPALVKRVRAAAVAHAERDVEQRARLLRKYANALLARGEELVKILVDECGKVEAEARLVEVIAIADLADYWCVEGMSHLETHEPELDAMSYPGKRGFVEHAPRGVVALITPWNFPVAIPLRTIFPALLAGDGIVLKPSEHVPRCGAILAEVAREVFGEDLVVCVQGGGDVGGALIGAGVDAVVFTGSVATGRKVAHAAADALIPAGLELGGKDAAIVLEDANLERTAQGIVWGAFANAGQNCASVERVYVVEKVAKELEEKVVALTKTLVLGRDVCPLTTPEQLAIVEKHVADAKERGANVLVGGARDEKPGLWFPPTVLTGVPRDAAILTDETFGPVLPLVVVKDEAEAVERANDSRYGLTASVWTRDLERGGRVARRLRAGVVMVNNHAFTGAVPSLPWSGVGESGFGVTNSPHALDVLARPRTVLIDASRAKREMWWFPYTPALSQVAHALTDLRRGGAGLGTKLRAVVALLRGFLARWKV